MNLKGGIKMLIEKDAIKLYKVSFNCYTNCTNSCVSNNKGEHCEYIEIPYGGLIIRENEFDFYSQYGNGFSSLTFVGSIYPEQNVSKAVTGEINIKSEETPKENACCDNCKYCGYSPTFDGLTKVCKYRETMHNIQCPNTIVCINDPIGVPCEHYKLNLEKDLVESAIALISKKSKK